MSLLLLVAEAIAKHTSQSDEYFFHFFQWKICLDVYSKYYKKNLLVGAFNAEKSEPYQPQILSRSQPTREV